MYGILEKFQEEALLKPDRELYNFLDCESKPFSENIATIGQAWKKSMEIAAELKAKGAKKGDRAIILSMQDCGTVYAVWGCMIAGVVFTLIPPPIDEGKLNRFVSVLKSCKPKYLISNEGLEKKSGNQVAGSLLRQAFLEVVSLKKIYTDKIKKYEGESILCSHEKDDLIYLQYTSGSTSAPKGVMVTYQNLMSCMELCQEIFDYKYTKQTLVTWVPFYHNIGLVVAIFMPVFADDAVSHFIPTLQFLQKPSIWLEILSKYRATITAAPNSAYEICTRIFSEKDAEKFNLSSVTHFINGSEVVDANTISKFSRLFKISSNSFAPGYGLSECVCVASLSSNDYHAVKIRSDAYFNNQFYPDENGDKTIVSLGRSAGDLKLVAVKPDGTPCGRGEIGEIYIQGSNVCSGYWKNEKETVAFQAKVKGFEGDFYRTGDMGIIHEGQLYLTGRMKEMIIISGKNVFPNDIILQLNKEGLPLPLNAISIFSLQKDGSEQPVFCTECEEDTDFRSLAAFINKIVFQSFEFSFADIVFIKKGTLPRTDNGKIQVIQTKNLYEANKLETLYSTVRHGKKEAKTVTKLNHKKIVLSKPAVPEDIQPLIRNIFESILPDKDFDLDDSFMEMGGDSLLMMELVCELENDLDITIDLREVIASPSIRGISDYISKLINGDLESIKTNLREECFLDNKITLENPYDCKAEECRNILLTGSTGFLGAYFIHSLIRQKSDKKINIYCHGRGDSEKALMERIEKNMQRFQCWEDYYRNYIIPVPGDLSMPYLGIQKDTYEDLAQKIDMVIHNGAILNFVFPYSKMKNTNVTGTARALEFACHKRAKYFHYISSYSVYDNPSHFEKKVLENDPLESPDGYFLGYSETKWVAEKLVKIGEKRGLRTTIYRPGDITGTLKDGIWKLEDLISRSIVGCIQLESVPEMEVNLHLTPVDFVADAIIHIAFQSEASGQAFNIINQNLMPLRRFYILLNKLGYKVEELPFDMWCDRLETCTSEENVLRVLSCLFTDKRANGEGLVERFGARQAQIDSSNTDRLLKGSGITCPAVNAALMKRYLEYFGECGYIPKPKESISGTIKGIYYSLKERK